MKLELSETFTFTGRQVQELVDACGVLQGRMRTEMRRVRGVSEAADEKRAAIRERQAVVAALVEKFMASGERA
jgi:hypothetical protein